MSEVVWNKYSKEEFNDVMKFSDEIGRAHV